MCKLVRASWNTSGGGNAEFDIVDDVGGGGVTLGSTSGDQRMFNPLGRRGLVLRLGLSPSSSGRDSHESICSMIVGSGSGASESLGSSG